MEVERVRIERDGGGESEGQRGMEVERVRDRER